MAEDVTGVGESAANNVALIEALLLSDAPLMDTRAPIEFAKGSFPQAVNLPLMTDDERAAVGTCYKQRGPDAAVALGHELVSGAIKDARIQQWKAFAEAHPTGALFCFRGGMRSAIVQAWLAEAGVVYPRVPGGYKAMRRWLMDELARICRDRTFIIVGGQTGAAKTRFLNEGNQGQPLRGRVDLEGIANHRGSAFGRRVEAQPSQISFEIALGIALLKVDRYHTGPILIEDESRLIGRCALPLELQHVVQTAPVVLLEASLEARVSHTFGNYILQNLEDYQNAATTGSQGFERFADSLRDALSRIRRRLGGVRYQALAEQLEAALVKHRAGDASDHKLWIATLLRDYYDPMYAYQLAGKRARVVFSGDEGAVAAWLLGRVSPTQPMTEDFDVGSLGK